MWSFLSPCNHSMSEMSLLYRAPSSLPDFVGKRIAILFRKRGIDDRGALEAEEGGGKKSPFAKIASNSSAELANQEWRPRNTRSAHLEALGPVHRIVAVHGLATVANGENIATLGA